MTAEDEFLKGWVGQLKTMQHCMKNVNTDTELDLAKFYRQKHAELLLNDMLKRTFCSCFPVPINDDQFKNSSTFGELLDHCYRPLDQAVIVVMRAVAVLHDATLGATPEEKFGSVAAARALPSTILEELSQRLESDMSPLFKAGVASAARLREALAKPNATVQSAAQAIP